MPAQVSYELKHVEIDEKTAVLYLELLEDPQKQEEHMHIVVTPEGGDQMVNQFMQVLNQMMGQGGPFKEMWAKSAKQKWELHGIPIPRKNYDDLGRPMPGTILHLTFLSEESAPKR